VSDSLEDRILELIRPVCGNCAKTLRENGPSPDFCSDICQTKWKAAQIDVALDRDYRPIIPGGLPSPITIGSLELPYIGDHYFVQFDQTHIFDPRPVAHFHLHADGTIEETSWRSSWQYRTPQEMEQEFAQLHESIARVFDVPIELLSPFGTLAMKPRPWYRRAWEATWGRIRYWLTGW